MNERKFRDGQIVWYIGDELVAYETGKTYTVLGYDDELDLYAIMSCLDNEVYLLPDRVLKPLSPEEEQTVKISDRMYEYYRETDETLFGTGWETIDEKRCRIIKDTAYHDVITNHFKKQRDEFNNDAEYNLYTFCVIENAQLMKHDLYKYVAYGTDHILSVFVFDPKNVIDADGRVKYSWRDSEPVYETTFPINDTELSNYLDKAVIYQSSAGYPSASCYLLDRNTLLEMADTFTDLFSSMNRSDITEQQYMIVESDWD